MPLSVDSYLTEQPCASLCDYIHMVAEEALGVAAETSQEAQSFSPGHGGGGGGMRGTQGPEG